MSQLILVKDNICDNLLHVDGLLLYILLIFMLNSSPVFAVEIYPKKITDYAWQIAANPCRYAFEDRRLRQGFVVDWQLESTCRSPDELWWVIKLRPYPLQLMHGYFSRNEEHIVAFHFEEDIFEMASEIYNEPYTGPPKWMPYALVYWDAYIGDWRYLSRPLERQMDSKSLEPELLMLTLKFEDFEQGLSWDATFDLHRLVELMDITYLRFDEFFIELFNEFRKD